MEQAQREYFIRRLNEISAEKLRNKERELFGEGGPQQPTWGMVFQAIIEGKITLKPGTENLTRAYLMPTDVEWPELEAKKQELCDYKGLLDRERQAAMDSCILDDAAAQALTRFQAV